MLRNVNGIWMQGKQASDEWTMRTYQLGNGHAESVISRPMVWTEVEPHVAAMLGDDWQALKDRELTPEEEAEKRERNRKRAARRATTAIRRRIKVMGLNALFTLTYKANQTDLALCKKHLKEFVRRTKRVLPGFRYVAAFEQQKRGAWHVHLVTDRLPAKLQHHSGVKVKSYNVMRGIWRSVIGALGGNFDQAKKVKAGRQSVAKLAAYVSKYMMKAFTEGDDWSNRYSGSEGVQVPPAVVLSFRDAQLAELIGLTFSDIAVADREVTMWLSRFGDVFYLSTEGPDGAFDLSANCR